MTLITFVLGLELTAFLIVWQAIRSDRSPWSADRWRHAAQGLAIYVLALGALAAVPRLGLPVMPTLILPTHVVDALTRSSLLPSLGAPTWVTAVLGVPLVDLCVYVAHRAQHAIPLLWRFHRVHHLDTHVDASTAFRNHPVAWVADKSLIQACGLLLGIPLASWSFCALVMTFNAPLQHSRVRFPPRVERALRWVFITPELHLLHHSPEPGSMHRNYAFLFSIWDRLFGTLDGRELESAGFRSGVEPYTGARWQTVWGMLVNPFVR